MPEGVAPAENLPGDFVKGGDVIRPRTLRIPGEVGIWVFVAGDLLVFAVFFIVIAQGQMEQPEVFTQSRSTLVLWVGVLNTLLLLTGSWLVAMGVDRARVTKKPVASYYFSLPILCAVAFIVNKGFEWGAKLSIGVTRASNDFYMLFFVFTGIHLLHVLVGVGVLLLIRIVSRRPTLTRRDIATMESGATFWHLVDLLWVVLFALFYLL